jgi:hypothetical protein
MRWDEMGWEENKGMLSSDFTFFNCFLIFLFYYFLFL